MKVINGNNIDILKQYPDNYFDAVVTDPPYGLGKEPNAEELMRDWIEKGYHEIQGSGFMGKEWDAFVPQPIFWKEVFRVLKHGGHVLAFYGTRTYDWGVMAMRFAGFEVRDSIQWLYGSGFPKSHNISKAINKMYGVEYDEIPASGVGFMKPNSEDWNVTKNQLVQKGESTKEAKQWDGWGSALKPANEPIVLARKPLEKGLSIAENVLKWGVGAINIDGCRVGSQVRTMPIFSNDSKTDGTTFNLNSNIQHHREETTQGRFPANIILTHHSECECIGTKKVKNGIASENGRGFGCGNVYGENNEKYNPSKSGYGNENGEEEVENWNCHDDCPIKILDEQSGESKSNNTKRNRNTIGSFGMPNDNTPEYNDKGGASRFFYVAKASKSERNKGLDGFEEKQPQHDFGTDFGESRATRTHTQTKNFHPTVKPIKLMQYLVRLITPTNGIVLDPFCGSGTTGIACKLEGFDFVGMEQDSEYCKIAEARIENYVEEGKSKNVKPEDKNMEGDNQLSMF